MPGREPGQWTTVPRPKTRLPAPIQPCLGGSRVFGRGTVVHCPELVDRGVTRHGSFANPLAARDSPHVWCGSHQRMTVGGGISPAAVEGQLPLDVRQRATRADPE